MENVVAAAIVVFGICILAESVYGAVRGRNTYALHDTIANLSQGLLSQWVVLLTRLFQVGLYAVAYEHLAFFRGAGFWEAWYGWVAAIVLFDFCEYWLHRTGHRSAIFWASHVVHHQSTSFNFSTALRQESLTALLGWPFYLPMALLGVPPESFLAAGLAVNFYQFWIHTEHVGKLGWFDRVFASPSNHRVHHAVNDAYLDRNYGGILIVWDRLFGTYAEERERCVYGTKKPLESRNPLWAIGAVYCAIARDAWRASGWRERLRVVFLPPEHLSASHAPPAAPPATTRWLAGALFLLPVLVTGLYLWDSDSLSWTEAAVGAAAVLAALVGIERLAR